jgi:hypothetical protein
MKHIKTFESFIDSSINEGKGTKFKNKYDAAEYFDASLEEEDAEIVDKFMEDNKLFPEVIAFLSPMEAKFSNTTLDAIKKELDTAGVKNIMWDSETEGEPRLAFSTK